MSNVNGASEVAAAPRSPWLFSPAIDLGVFLGSALLSLALLAAAPWLGVSTGPAGDPTSSPEWSWLVAVLLVDVAHVWSTAFVVYLDPAEWRRRPALYAGAPIAAWLAGVALHQLGGADLFWRAVAYLAAFHFVRQQYGWVMMYRGRAGERDRLGRWIDGATIYATTLVPLILWHTQLPRAFWWMREGDFAAGLPALVGALALVIYAVLAIAYVVRAVADARRRPISWGKHVVVVTSGVCWYLGIVATNSDYAFTVTNVFTHGIPYAALIFLYARRAAERPESAHGLAARIVRRGVLPFLATLWAVAYLEELLWDRGVWHDHPALFGGAPEHAGLEALAPWLVPLLAVPQLTHYFLDGFLWRRAANPRLGELLGRATG
jgi:hypothetical protein